jgi:F-type H+-transporting ATPase subunit b
MAEQHTTHETIEVSQHASEHHGAADSLLAANQGLVLWTWVTFILVCIVLYKVAWKPMLSGLDERERDIRKSLDDAEKIRDEMARLGQTQQRMLGEAEDQAKTILTEARKGAAEAARTIESRAREEAQILVENATRDLAAAQEKARADLRRESTEIAVTLAGRIIEEKLDAEKDRALVDRLIEEL